MVRSVKGRRTKEEENMENGEVRFVHNRRH